MPHQPIDKTPYDNLYFLGVLGLVFFFAFFQTAQLPLLDSIESRNGINALEMWANQDWTSVTYGNQPDVWNAKPPLSIWVTALSFKVFGLNEFGLRFPMALATIFLFIFLYRTIRLYQQADFAFFSCLLLLAAKGLVGRHITDLGNYDAIFTCLAMAGTYYFLKYHDFNRNTSLYWSALCFGLSFMSKGFGVFVFLIGILAYVLIRRQFLKKIVNRRFLIAILIFSIFPVLWLYLNKGQWQTTLYSNIYQDFFKYTMQYEGRDWLLFYNYLAAQFEYWHWIFLLSIPIGLWLIYINKADLKSNLTNEVVNYEPTSQVPRSRQFTISELLSRSDLKPNIQLLLFSICIWVVLAIVCTTSQNEQYLAFALPFIAITTAACIFYLNNRLEWFRAVFIGLLIFTFWGQIDFYLKNKNIPTVITANQELLKSNQSLAVDADLPAQDVFLYLRFYQPNLAILNSDKAIDSDLIFTRVENMDRYSGSRIIYEDETYAVLMPVYEDVMEL